jgi:hypothetical protein
VVSTDRVEPTSKEIEQSRVTNATRLAKLNRDAPFSKRDEERILVTNQLREGFSP